MTPLASGCSCQPGPWWSAETDDEMTGEFNQLFDRAAELTSGSVDFDQARELISGDDRPRVPETVLSDAPFNGPATVTLRT